MNGSTAIDSVRPILFWADKATVAADFPLMK